MRPFLALLALLAFVFAPLSAQPGAPVTALIGGTLIDGNGGPPVADAVVLLSGARITAAGSRAAVSIPAGATRVDASGRWILPGFIDTNVHLSLYGGQNDRYETLVRYQHRQDEIVLEAAQIDLSYGVTTVRDSYGMLLPLVRVREAINRGDAIGARILAAGNILGWSGPYSFSFSRVMGQLTLFQEQMNDEIAQGGGEELMAMTPDELPPRDRRLHRQGPGLHQVRRHEPLLGADVHRLLARCPEGDRGRSASPRPVRRNARHERGRAARGAGRRHRRHPASGAARWTRHPRRRRCGDPRARHHLLDAGQHHHRAGVAASSEGARGDHEEAPGRRERPARPAARQDHGGAAQGGGGHGRGPRVAAAQRADARSRGAQRSRPAPTATGPRRRS